MTGLHDVAEPRLTQEDVWVRIALALERIAERVTDQMVNDYWMLQFYARSPDRSDTDAAELAVVEARHPWLKAEAPHAPDRK